MTSPSRKKRPTTPPSIRQESLPNSSSGQSSAPVTLHLDGRYHSRGESVWLPAALLATLALLVFALQSRGGEPTQLQWRRASIPRSTGASTSRNYPVRQVAYNSGVWQPSSSQRQEARTFAPVGRVSADELVMQDSRVRLAQQPEPLDLGDDLSTPFTDDLPPLNELPFGEPSNPVLGEPIPAVDGNEIQPLDGQPIEGQPINGDEEFDSGLVDPFGEQPQPPIDTPPTDITPLETPIDSGTDPGFQPPTIRPIDDPPMTEGGEDPELAERRQEAMEDCSEELAELKASTLRDIDISIRLAGVEGNSYPFDCRLDDGSLFQPRSWCEVTYMWKAAANCHKPLFFEDVHLERYGHSWGPGLQPIVSGVHFFSRVPVIPYMAGLTPPNECMYPLGYYRPGNCAPYMIDPIPFTWRAALFEAGAWTAGAAIVP